MHPEKTASDLLAFDCAAETDRIAASLRAYLQKNRRRGLVLGLSGGIDSTVTAALAVRAVGAERVFGLHMPECQSEDATLVLSRSVARWLAIPDALEDITPLLEAAGFFRRYVEAARKVIPEFENSWKSKVVIHATGGSQTFSYFSLVGQSPDGRNVTARLSLEAYLEIVAATNFKQRTRKMLEYYHADRLNFAVAGTPNRLEYDQGFFVKNGDGAADIKPIAHLYKTQVYRLAEYLGVPAEIRQRPPTTDTYSLPQGQDEFYFALPYQQMDLCLFGKNRGLPADTIAKAAGLDVPMVERVWADIDRKRATTHYLHLKPALVESVPEVSS
ncbi:MAG TPA: NAD(+) synthase [Lacunisphaera sp.]